MNKSQNSIGKKQRYLHPKVSWSLEIKMISNSL